MQKFMSQYGVVFVLILLCAYYSFATLNPQHPGDAATGRKLAELHRAGNCQTPTC